MSDPPTYDPETVSIQGSYRIGFLPPLAGSLAAGEMFLEMQPHPAPPRLWVGTLRGVGYEGDMAVVVGEPGTPREPPAPPVEEPPPEPEPEPEPEKAPEEPEPDPERASNIGRRFRR